MISGPLSYRVFRETGPWTSQNSLGEHFVGFLGEMQKALENGNLSHYWLSGVNVLEDIDKVVMKAISYKKA